MRIAYDYQTFTMQAYGGISRYFVRLSEELRQDGQEIRIFAPYHCNQLLDTLDQSVVQGKKIYSKDFPRPITLALLLINQLASKNTIGKWKPDIVHETYYALSRSAPKKCPVVITVYDMIHEKFPQHFHKVDPTSFLKKTAIKRADHIICISESTKRDLVQFFPFVENKVSVVHLGFSLSNAKEKSVLADRPYLLYVGSRGGHKNFSGLLNSFSNSDKLRSGFDLVAFGGGAFGISEIEVINNLKFGPGQVRQISGDDTALATYYKNAAAFVYPSFYEGFGLPPLEAMAQNCPVVSSNTSSMPEVIGEAAEFFDPTSGDQITHAIENVVFSPSRSEELIALGKKRLELFTWNNCANQTYQIYTRLVNSHGR